MSKKTWNLAIVESNFLVCAGFTSIFSRTAFKERLECANMDELWTSIQSDSDIDLFLIDIGVNFSPFAADVAKLKEHFPESFIVVLVDRVDDDLVGPVLKAGVHGLLTKAMRIEAIVKSLELILLGEPFFPPASMKRFEATERNGSYENGSSGGSNINGHSHHLNFSGVNLSAREVEVLMSLREGRSNKEIARDLDISDATVKVHVKAILRKLRMKNRTEAALWATKSGLSNNSMH